ncbi:MAG: hypothetical protein ACYSRZ_01845 [Planctomycetota bacterium]
MNAEVFPFKDTYWQARGSSKLLTYVGPALQRNLQPLAVQQFIREKGAWAAMWNYEQDYTEQGPWYRCICDAADYNISNIKSKNVRHNVNRSLKRCVVRQVDYSWLAENGYEVHTNAASRYNNFKVKSKNDFIKEMRGNSSVPDSKAFGVFVGEKLAAYITLFICRQTVRGDTAHFDPAYSNAYPMYALYYTITHHYLKEKGYKEIDRGTRPLMHETNIDDFLLRLGYRKAYCRLGIYFTWPVRAVLRLARISRRVCKTLLPGRYYAILEGLLLAQDIAKATNAK